MPVVHGQLLCQRCNWEHTTAVAACAFVSLPLVPLQAMGCAFTDWVGSTLISQRWPYRDQQGRCAACGRDPEATEVFVDKHAFPAPLIGLAKKEAAAEPKPFEEIQLDFLLASAETREILSQKPTSADDVNIVPHVLRAIAGENRVVMFCREGGVQGTALQLLHMLRGEVEGESMPWDMKLSSCPGWCPAVSADQLLADDTLLTRFKQEATSRIAKSIGVELYQVIITEVVPDSIHVKFTVADLDARQKELILRADLVGKLRGEFNTFESLKVSPVALSLEFNLSDLDKRGNKDGSSFKGAFEVGPPGNTRKYVQPNGYSRYGFKVLGKYDRDEWLAPFKNPCNWYRAFYGTRHDDSIFINSSGTLGAGVYVSPCSEYIDAHSCGVLQFELEGGKWQNFKYLLQVAVRPGAIINEGYPDSSGTNQEWFVGKDDVRPYGLLVREM